MELWLIVGILAAVFSGISGFAQKIAVENKTDSFFLAFSQGVLMTLLSALYLIYTRKDFLITGEDKLLAVFLIGALSCAQFLIIRVRAEALKYLSSSEYFISFRILMVLILTGIGLFLFSETLSYSQILGLFIGFIGIALLFEEDTKFQHSRKWFHAISFLTLSIILGAIIQLSAKYLAIESGELVTIIFYEGVFLLVLSSIFYGKNIGEIFHKPIRSKDFSIAVFFGITIYLAAITNFLAFYYNGPIGIVTKILGYSVFIPIMLSMIFYGEKMSYKKGIAFVLTIISIYYLN